jgi:hypothetical protein
VRASTSFFVRMLKQRAIGREKEVYHSVVVGGGGGGGGGGGVGGGGMCVRVGKKLRLPAWQEIHPTAH